jgi:hypothetical protein
MVAHRARYDLFRLCFRQICEACREGRRFGRFSVRLPLRLPPIESGASICQLGYMLKQRKREFVDEHASEDCPPCRHAGWCKKARYGSAALR